MYVGQIKAVLRGNLVQRHSHLLVPHHDVPDLDPPALDMRLAARVAGSDVYMSIHICVRWSRIHHAPLQDYTEWVFEEVFDFVEEHRALGAVHYAVVG